MPQGAAMRGPVAGFAPEIALAPHLPMASVFQPPKPQATLEMRWSALFAIPLPLRSDILCACLLLVVAA